MTIALCRIVNANQWTERWRGRGKGYVTTLLLKIIVYTVLDRNIGMPHRNNKIITSTMLVCLPLHIRERAHGIVLNKGIDRGCGWLAD
jgi:hypothetical protein